LLEGDLLGLNLGDPAGNNGTSLPKATSNVDLLGGFDSRMNTDTIKPSSTPTQSSDIFDPFGIVNSTGFKSCTILMVKISG
jgi:hypothetical protein